MKISRNRILKILNSSNQSRKKTNAKRRKSTSNGGKRRTNSKRHGKRNLRYRTLKKQKGGSTNREEELQGPVENPIISQASSAPQNQAKQLSTSVPTEDLLGLNQTQPQTKSSDIVDGNRPSAFGPEDLSATSRPVAKEQRDSQDQCINWLSGIIKSDNAPEGNEEGYTYGFTNVFNDQDPGSAESAYEVLQICPNKDVDDFKTIEMPPDGNCGWYSILQWLENTRVNYPKYYNLLDDQVKGFCGSVGQQSVESLCKPESLVPGQSFGLREYNNQLKQGTTMDMYTDAWKERVNALRDYIRKDLRQLDQDPNREADLQDQYLNGEDFDWVAQALKMTVIQFHIGATQLKDWGYSVPHNTPTAFGIFTGINNLEPNEYPMPLIFKSQANYYPSKDGVKAGGHFDVLEPRNSDEKVFMKIEKGNFVSNRNQIDRQTGNDEVQTVQKSISKDLSSTQSGSPDFGASSTFPSKQQMSMQMNQQSTQNTEPNTPPPSPQSVKRQSNSRGKPVDPVVSTTPKTSPVQKQDMSVSSSTVSKQLPDGSMEFTIKVIVPNNAATSVSGSGGDNFDASVGSFLNAAKGTSNSGDSDQITEKAGEEASSGTTTDSPSQPPSNTVANTNTGNPSSGVSFGPETKGEAAPIPGKIDSCDYLDEARRKQLNGWDKLTGEALEQAINTLQTQPEVTCAMTLYNENPDILAKIVAKRNELKLGCNGLEEDVKDKLVGWDKLSAEELDKVLNELKINIKINALRCARNMYKDNSEILAKINATIEELRACDDPRGNKKLTHEEAMKMMRWRELSEEQLDEAIKALKTEYEAKCAMSIYKNVYPEPNIVSKISAKLDEIESEAGEESGSVNSANTGSADENDDPDGDNPDSESAELQAWRKMDPKKRITPEELDKLSEDDFIRLQGSKNPNKRTKADILADANKLQTAEKSNNEDEVRRLNEEFDKLDALMFQRRVNAIKKAN